MAKTSPTQRSLKLMRDRGYLCAVTERWNPHAHIRQDLWGFCDILCVAADSRIAVQTTTLAHMNDRIAKIKAHPNFPVVYGSGIEVVVHGWRKLKSGWTCKEAMVTP